jgi:hypothetical protein
VITILAHGTRRVGITGKIIKVYFEVYLIITLIPNRLDIRNAIASTLIEVKILFIVTLIST